MSVKNITVDHDNEGRRIDNFLFSNFKNIPKSKIYKVIRKGEVRVNSKRVKPDTKLSKNDLIRIPPNLINQEKTLDINISKYAFLKDRVIYDDEDFLIFNKPSNYAVHSGTKNDHGLIDILRAVLKDNSLNLCHRLDKGTSGCLVIAKNQKFLGSFNNQLKQRKVKKIYHAIVKDFISEEMVIEDSIDTNTKGSFNKVSINKNGKEAKSILKPLKKLDCSSLIEIEILTGRTHQIRAQCAKINKNIANDKKYGCKDFNTRLKHSGIKRLGLHSSEISFLDLENKINTFVADYDDQFEKMLSYLNT